MTPQQTMPRARATQSPLNVIRGFLIGMAELVPGISGGTVALVLGVYERALRAVNSLASAVKALIAGPDRLRGFRREIAGIEWWLILPALVGMVGALLFAAGPVKHLVETYPENARGLFFGLVVASFVVLFRIMPRGRSTVLGIVGDIAIIVIAGAVAFTLVGLAGGQTVEEPSVWFIALAAALAVCALVVPGLSGSFFLLALGLYEPTLQAVADRDFAYLGIFLVGALVGLFTIAKVVSFLLEHRRRITLVVMIGLMAGSLRALWPWQGGPGGSEGHGTLLAPTDPLVPILLAILGAAVVIGFIVAESMILRRRSARPVE
ncbi:DUF368 domain-containing protein [Microbacterium sp. gxy059]|uniref:DUF368 domain-containing protein n=1 Tax=Microbacterium sp. gxy059 TaxID=2957199 RepID=UPI003D96B0C5